MIIVYHLMLLDDVMEGFMEGWAIDGGIFGWIDKEIEGGTILTEKQCSLSSRQGLVQEDKRMALVYTHGLFIT
jgi:hypothetical protein